MTQFNQEKYLHVTSWDLLLHRLIWKQLNFLRGKSVLDFGSGNGITSDYLAADHTVTAVEPSESMLKSTFRENDYQQIKGSAEVLKRFPDNSFDVVVCHNVLEYIKDKGNIVQEFYRVLNPGGYLSIVKHNKAGRVMQTVVLLNDFDHANDLLDGKNGISSQFGTIMYYEDHDITKWCPGFKPDQCYGLRTFWDLQQNQEIHKDINWQEKMLDIDSRVSQIEEYYNIAFFHHLLLKKL